MDQSSINYHKNFLFTSFELEAKNEMPMVNQLKLKEKKPNTTISYWEGRGFSVIMMIGLLIQHECGKSIHWKSNCFVKKKMHMNS